MTFHTTPDLSVYVLLPGFFTRRKLCEIKECLFASGSPVPTTDLGTESLLYKYLLSA